MFGGVAAEKNQQNRRQENMEKMLVVVFDNETNAYDGSRELIYLDSEGSITVHAAAVVGRADNGALTVEKVVEEFPIRVVGGTAIGGLIGLLGGLPGFVAGTVAGSMVGGTGDIYNDLVDSDFLSDVSAKLTPGKFAVVADLSEEWTTPLDSRMEKLDGTVFRTAKQNVEDARRAREIRELKAEIDGLKAEQTQATAARKAKLQAKIDLLNAKMKDKQERAKQRLDQRMSEDDAKIKSIKEKEAKARGDAKSSLKARKAEISKSYHETARNMKNMEAEHLDRMAKNLGNKAEKLRKG